MKTLTVSMEDSPSFAPLFRFLQQKSRNPRWLQRLLAAPSRKQPPLSPGSKIIASFGSVDLILHSDGLWDLRGGTPAEQATVREWCSLFQHEATFAAPAAATIPDPAPDRTQAPSPKRILVADDDALVRASLAAVLESEGYTVDEAADGREAVRLAVAEPPNLVLLDLNMPGWDGWTAFTRLDRVTPLVPVIVITARPNEYEKAIKLGVDAFMEKPLNLPILLRAIHHFTSEESERHMRRITDRGFVTKLLGGTSCAS